LTGFFDGVSCRGGGLCTFHSCRHYRDVVENYGSAVNYLFHDRLIARIENGRLELWNREVTTTTRDRLSAILRRAADGYIGIMCNMMVFSKGYGDNELYDFDKIEVDLKSGQVDHVVGRRLRRVWRRGRRTVNFFDNYITVNVSGKRGYLLDHTDYNIYRLITSYRPMFSDSRCWLYVKLHRLFPDEIEDLKRFDVALPFLVGKLMQT